MKSVGLLISLCTVNIMYNMDPVNQKPICHLVIDSKENSRKNSIDSIEVINNENSKKRSHEPFSSSSDFHSFSDLVKQPSKEEKEKYDFLLPDKQTIMFEFSQQSNNVVLHNINRVNSCDGKMNYYGNRHNNNNPKKATIIKQDQDIWDLNIITKHTLGRVKSQENLRRKITLGDISLHALKKQQKEIECQRKMRFWQEEQKKQLEKLQNQLKEKNNLGIMEKVNLKMQIQNLQNENHQLIQDKERKGLLNTINNLKIHNQNISDELKEKNILLKEYQDKIQQLLKKINKKKNQKK